VVFQMNYQHQDIVTLGVQVRDLAMAPEGAMPDHKTIVNVLMETSQLLQQKGWNKFSMARDPHGEGVGVNSKDASCYCLSGGLVKAWRTVDPQNEDFYFRYFEKKISDILRESYGYDCTFTRWNDEVATCRDDVVALIHSVITSILRDAAASNSSLA
jgi:hypothetical protein